MKPVGITFGDFNGISPEITIKALNELDMPSDNFILFTSSDLLEFYSKNFNLSLKKKYKIAEIPFKKEDMNIGTDTKEAGEFAFTALKQACLYGKEGRISAIATAPVSKNAMHLAGHYYSGQTEVLEKFAGHDAQKSEMLFTECECRVLLLTRHEAISKLSKLITEDLITDKINRLNSSLKKNFNIRNPKISLCALNPHAGENGLFGTEEINSIIPAVKKLKSEKIAIEGPFPADSLFASLAEDIKNNKSPKYDCYVAVFHDQGLIPMKLLFGKTAVNTTIGLDIIRTSPAHGTAFDIAGKMIAESTGMISAIKAAINFGKSA